MPGPRVETLWGIVLQASTASQAAPSLAKFEISALLNLSKAKRRNMHLALEEQCASRNKIPHSVTNSLRPFSLREGISNEQNGRVFHRDAVRQRGSV